MQIIYEGVDITNIVDIRKADIVDTAGGQADSIEINFSDTEGLWSKWKPLKGHKINFLESGFSSGTMYSDVILQNRGSIRIKGLSLPPEAKTEKTKAWESIRFIEMAREITRKYGFALETYNIIDFTYQRIDQRDENDFDFLLRRCILEGYVLKIYNSKIVIYDEQTYESQPAVKKIYQDQFDGDFEFKSVSSGLYSSCVLNCTTATGVIKKEFRPVVAPAGPVLKPKIFVSNLAEADRFGRGLLRSANKYEYVGKCQIQLDPDLAAGNCVDIIGVGLADGKYFIDQTVHRLVDKKTVLKLRKPLEGY